MPASFASTASKGSNPAPAHGPTSSGVIPSAIARTASQARSPTRTQRTRGCPGDRPCLTSPVDLDRGERAPSRAGRLMSGRKPAPQRLRPAVRAGPAAASATRTGRFFPGPAAQSPPGPLEPLVDLFRLAREEREARRPVPRGPGGREAADNRQVHAVIGSGITNSALGIAPRRDRLGVLDQPLADEDDAASLASRCSRVRSAIVPWPTHAMNLGSSRACGSSGPAAHR